MVLGKHWMTGLMTLSKISSFIGVNLKADTFQLFSQSDMPFPRYLVKQNSLKIVPSFGNKTQVQVHWI